MKISTGYVNYIYKKYKENGPERIGKYLKKINIIISKNSIYKILLSLNMVNEDKNKKKQRKYVKYERSNSNSLWHIE